MGGGSSEFDACWRRRSQCARQFVIAVFAVAVTGCGGGGGGGGGAAPPPSNRAPVFTSAAALSASESTPFELNIGVSDPDGDPVTLTLEAGGDAARFTIDSAARKLLRTSGLNFEFPDDADEDNTYLFTIRAIAGAHVVSRDFALTVIDAPEPSFEQIGALALTADFGDTSGQSVSATTLGDLDVDGLSDIAIGVNALQAGNPNRPYAGSTLVFSGARLNAIMGPVKSFDQAIADGDSGRIIGSEQLASSGAYIMGQTDFDGDGLNELLLAEPFTAFGPNPASQTLALFGTDLRALMQNRQTIDLAVSAEADLATSIVGGYTVYAGAIAPAGDVDNDAVPDFIICDPYAGGAAARERSGVTYVIFGAALRQAHMASADMTLANITTLGQGVRLDGAEMHDGSCWSAAAGDFDGDGHADVFVSSPAITQDDQTRGGHAYLVFGSAISVARNGGGVIDLATLVANGQGVHFLREENTVIGPPVGAGDMNGDGRTDFLISRSVGGSAAGAHPDVAYLLHGGQVTAGEMSLADFAGSRSAVTFRRGSPNNVLTAVAFAGDVDGDGRADVLMTYATDSDPELRGLVYLVFGSELQSPGQFMLEDMPSSIAAIRLVGIDLLNGLGLRLAALGDINGDGYDDIMLGGTCRRSGPQTCSESYLLSGRWLAREKLRDRLVELDAVFPELVNP